MACKNGPIFGGTLIVQYLIILDSITTNHFAYVGLLTAAKSFVSENILRLSLEVVEKTTLHSFWASNFFGSDDPSFYGDLPPTVWQSLVVFRSLTSVCEAWQWSTMQNLRRPTGTWRHPQGTLAGRAVSFCSLSRNGHARR